MGFLEATRFIEMGFLEATRFIEMGFLGCSIPSTAGSSLLKSFLNIAVSRTSVIHVYSVAIDATVQFIYIHTVDVCVVLKSSLHSKVTQRCQELLLKSI